MLNHFDIFPHLMVAKGTCLHLIRQGPHKVSFMVLVIGCFALIKEAARLPLEKWRSTPNDISLTLTLCSIVFQG